MIFVGSKGNVVVDSVHRFIGRSIVLGHLGNFILHGGSIVPVLWTATLNRSAVGTVVHPLGIAETGIPALHLPPHGLRCHPLLGSIGSFRILSHCLTVSPIKKLHPFCVDPQPGAFGSGFFFGPLIIDQSSFDKNRGALLQKTGGTFRLFAPDGNVYETGFIFFLAVGLPETALPPGV